MAVSQNNIMYLAICAPDENVHVYRLVNDSWEKLTRDGFPQGLSANPELAFDNEGSLWIAVADKDAYTGAEGCYSPHLLKYTERGL